MSLTPAWRKASASNPSGNCVEARQRRGVVQVRDSKDRSGPTLEISPATWEAFLAGIKVEGGDRRS